MAQKNVMVGFPEDLLAAAQELASSTNRPFAAVVRAGLRRELDAKGVKGACETCAKIRAVLSAGEG